jgi:alpha-tubulin suppressor-like RCC1 family protein
VRRVVRQCGARRARSLLPAMLASALLLALVASGSAGARIPGPLSASVAAETNKAPKVTKQPSSVTTEAGQSATFSSTASGVPAPTVQWEVSTNGGAAWSPIEGATSGTFTIAATKTSETANQLRAVYKNIAGEATSKAVTLTVQQAPAISKQPLSTTVEEGQNAAFEAAASGSPVPSVKWETSANGGKTWTAVAGGTSSTLTIAGAKTTSSGHEYRASFKNTVGEATTEAATLTVQKAPAVTKQPVSLTVNEGQSAVFEATASGFPAPTVQWQLSTDAGGTWSPIEAASTNQLTIASVSIVEDGYEYRAVFANPAGGATSQPATLTVHAPPVVTQQPIGATIEVGQSAVFEATASGFPAPTVQWEISTNGGSTWSAVAGATATQLTIEHATTAESGHRYRAVFVNVSGTTTSNAVTLTVVTDHFGAVAWGDNVYRQLGDGFKETSSTQPVPVTGLKFVTAIAAGGRHSLALLADGTVVAWGANGRGQLGDASTSESSVPVAVQGLSGVKAIATGGSHSLALLAGGTVMAWGDNEAGQLGTGSSIEDSEVPVTVKGLANVQAISAGAGYSLALLANGTVMAWGENESGQLGDGKYAQSNTPVPVKNLKGVTAISAGGEFGLALLGDKTVRAWGNDERAQLGNASVEEGNSNLPASVEGLSGVAAIAAGADHGLALLSGGTVVAWGDDTAGELGDGTIKPFSVAPVSVGGLAGATTISAGGQDSVALLGSGAVKTWGTNASGVLGDGVLGGTSAVPVTVIGLTKAVSVSAGRSHMLAFGEPIPTVASVSPNVGPTAGGTVVTINGNTFTGASSVKFGSAQASSFTVDSASSITALAPPGTGTVDVTVTTPSGTSPTGSFDHFTFQAPPIVAKLATKSGPATGGTSVTITGSEFTAATSVSFGQTSAPSFTVNSPTSITAVAPPGIGGTVDVHVSNTAGTSSSSSKDRFKYLPVVEGVAPGSGPASGGTSVTVTGSGFALGSSATSFKFGTVKAKAVSCTSTTTCQVTTPTHAAGTVDVVATANKAASAPNAPADQFTYS